jgi:hypothetical protein
VSSPHTFSVSKRSMAACVVGGTVVSSSRKTTDHVAVLREALRVAGPRHGQEAHAVRRRDRKPAEILGLPNRTDQDDDLASDPDTLESRLEALGELGLADARESPSCASGCAPAGRSRSAERNVETPSKP